MPTPSLLAKGVVSQVGELMIAVVAKQSRGPCSGGRLLGRQTDRAVLVAVPANKIAERQT